jgi:Sortase domain
MVVLAAPLLALAVACGPSSTATAPSAPELAAASSSVSTAPTAPRLARSTPVSLSIPKLGVSSTLVPLGLSSDGSVQVPPVSTPMQAGWYDNGPTPGEIGPAVLLGHVDGDHQKGVFYTLHELAAGDQVSVTRQDGATARFTVTKVDQVSKATFPTDAVYGDTSDAELRLITCGGSFDAAAHSYRDNIVVYAVYTPGS